MLNLKLRNSVQDKIVFNNTYIESAIFSLWKINLFNLIKTKAVLAKNFHIQPSEIDKMPMWEYELFIDEIIKLNKEENDKQEAEMKKYHVDDYMKSADPKNINKMANMNSVPMPKMPSIKY